MHRVSLNVAKPVKHQQLRDQSPHSIVSENVEFVPCVTEIQTPTKYQNVIDGVDRLEYPENKLAKIIARKENEFVWPVQVIVEYSNFINFHFIE